MNSPAAKIQCVSDLCNYEMDPYWDFCPYCGADNRPPSRKDQKVRHHFHRYLHREGCCLICGEPYDEPYFLKRAWRVRIATVLLLFAMVSLLWSVNVALAGIDGLSVAKSYIRSWYDTPTVHRGRYGPRHSTIGRDQIQLFVLLGLVAGIFGTLMLFKQPLRWLERRTD